MTARFSSTVLCVLLAGCLSASRAPAGRAAAAGNAGAQPNSTLQLADGAAPQSALDGYVPSVRTGNQVALNTARSAFAGYLNAMHNRIHPLFSDSWLATLDSLPATQALNNPRLSTNLEIVLEQKSGDIERMGVIRSSGNNAFDSAVLYVVKRAAPYGTPPQEIVSPDGNVYVHWAFHRNSEACSPFNARPFLLKAQATARPGSFTPPAP